MGRASLAVSVDAPAGARVQPDHLTVDPGSSRQHPLVAATKDLASVGRTAAARAAHHAAYRVAEVGVDGRVEDKVDGKVHRLKQIPYRHRNVENVRAVARLNGQIAEEAQQLGRNEKDDEEDDDDDEGEGDTVGGLFAAFTGGPLLGGGSHRPHRRIERILCVQLTTRQHRQAQRLDEVDVAEYQHAQRHDDSQGKVGPQIRDLGSRKTLQRSREGDVHARRFPR